MLCDAHCHFFSSRFLELLTQALPRTLRRTVAPAPCRRMLGWDPPGTAEALADRWVAELDRHGVARSTLIASIPGDEAIGPRRPWRAIRSDSSAFFMFNPAAPDRRRAADDAARRIGRFALIALFPAMHRYRLDDPAVETRLRGGGGRRRRRVRALRRADRRRAQAPRPAVAVRSAARRSAGGRGRRGALPDRAGHRPALRRRLLPRSADGGRQCANIHLDTSSSNGWMKYHPGLTLEAVFRQALAVAGPDRLLFGTDSSFFPRGWQKPVYDAQVAALTAANASARRPQADPRRQLRPPVSAAVVDTHSRRARLDNDPCSDVRDVVAAAALVSSTCRPRRSRRTRSRAGRHAGRPRAHQRPRRHRRGRRAGGPGDRRRRRPHRRARHERRDRSDTSDQRRR